MANSKNAVLRRAAECVSPIDIGGNLFRLAEMNFGADGGRCRTCQALLIEEKCNYCGDDQKKRTDPDGDE